jgi:hypothetical protein
MGGFGTQTTQTPLTTNRTTGALAGALAGGLGGYALGQIPGVSNFLGAAAPYAGAGGAALGGLLGYFGLD